MNYRHAFHAGNHIDVFKHAALTLVLERLLAKPQPFAVLDTHAGIGVYDLTSDEATRTGEFQEGVVMTRFFSEVILREHGPGAYEPIAEQPEAVPEQA